MSQVEQPEDNMSFPEHPASVENLSETYGRRKAELLETVRLKTRRAEGVVTLDTLGNTIKNCISTYSQAELHHALVNLYELQGLARRGKAEGDIETLQRNIDIVDALIVGFEYHERLMARQAHEK